MDIHLLRTSIFLSMVNYAILQTMRNITRRFYGRQFYLFHEDSRLIASSWAVLWHLCLTVLFATCRRSHVCFFSINLHNSSMLLRLCLDLRLYIYKKYKHGFWFFKLCKYVRAICLLIKNRKVTYDYCLQFANIYYIVVTKEKQRNVKTSEKKEIINQMFHISHAF